MREFISRILLGLFSANETGFTAVAAILMIIEACLSHFVIIKVKYTEIDWSTYMQQVECYVNKGILNYTEIGGDTGPIVYPAGHLFVYRVLYFITSSGRNIRLAQHIFQAFYLFNIFMVFRILQKTMRIPPIVLFLVTVTGYRIHSIFMLRLFNDPLAMMLFYVAMDRFLEEKWLVGCIFYSLAVSIKMNVLLFAPALFFTLILNNTFSSTFGYLALCGVIQLYVGSPFLIHDWRSYVQRSFDLGRVFMFKWTVNWRFLPEEFFLDKRFHIALLVGHLTFLAVFAWYMWFRRLNGLRGSLSVRVFEGIITSTGSLETYYAFCTANLIGIAFSRSLHYQFYSWYFHQLPFLLFCDYPRVDSTSNIPWKQFLWKVPLLLAIELCWNVYPSTWWSSALLHICHIIIFWHLISTRPARPIDLVSDDTHKRLQKRQNRLQKTLDEYGTVVPRGKVPFYMFEDEEEKKEAVKKLRKEKKAQGELMQKTEEELDDDFENYYEEQMKAFRGQHKIYHTNDDEMQVTGLPPLGDSNKLKLNEKMTALYAHALTVQADLNAAPTDEKNNELAGTDKSKKVAETDETPEASSSEDSVKTDESDECTDSGEDQMENISCSIESLVSEEEEVQEAKNTENTNGIRKRISVARREDSNVKNAILG